MIRIMCVLLAAGALAVAGCGGDDDEGGQAPAPAQTAPATTPAEGAGEAVEVEMRNIAFDPEDVTVKVGQTIRWENYDSVDHNAVATEGEDFKSDNFGKGGEYEFTAEKAGTITYVCTLHPGMDGTITVTE